ncbi:hypothetical protein V6N13_004470 [Hibiscus sabdariffa]
MFELTVATIKSVVIRPPTARSFLFKSRNNPYSHPGNLFLGWMEPTLDEESESKLERKQAKIMSSKDGIKLAENDPTC